MPPGKILLRLILLLANLVSFGDAFISTLPLPKSYEDCYKRYAKVSLSRVEGYLIVWQCDEMRRNADTKMSPAVPKQTHDYLQELTDKVLQQRKKRSIKSKCLRKEYRRLSDEERQKFHKAIRMLKADTSVPPNRYEALAKLHSGRVLMSSHGGANFLGWHRFYLVIFEEALQEMVPGVCIPYWDSSLDNELLDPTYSPLWSEKFLGNCDGDIHLGPFANWSYGEHEILVRNGGSGGNLFSKEIIDDILAQYDYRDVIVSTSNPEYNIDLQHGAVHVFVGGAMEVLRTAPQDPIFIMHHCFIDYIWFLFRKRLRYLGVDPEVYPDDPGNDDHAPDVPLGFGKLKAKDGYLESMAESFEYEESPTCSPQNLSCGTPYLKCDPYRSRCYPVLPGTESEPSTNEYPTDSSTTASSTYSSSSTTVTPGYRTASTKPGYKAATKNPGYKADTTNPGYKADTTNPGYQAATTNPGYQVATTIPGYRAATTAAPRNYAKTRESTEAREYDEPSPTTFPYQSPRTKRPGQPKKKGRLGRVTRRQATYQSPLKPADQDPPKENCDTKKSEPRSYQNTYCLNTKCDMNGWAYIAAKVVSIRPPNYKSYGSHPVIGGLLRNYQDIYTLNVSSILSAEPGRPKASSECNPDSSVGQVYVQSRGLNYEGFYKESALVDYRLGISVSTAYLAVKHPGKDFTEAILRAYDSCGRICRTVCLVHGSNPPRYENCSGAIRVSQQEPLMYGDTYAEATAYALGQDSQQGLPNFNADFYIIFYCDFSNRLPWVPTPPVLEEHPIRRLYNSLVGLLNPLLGGLLTSGSKSSVDTKVSVNSKVSVSTKVSLDTKISLGLSLGKNTYQSTTTCRLSFHCTINAPCLVASYQECGATRVKPCGISCRYYAVCRNNRYQQESCPLGTRFDLLLERCVSGFCYERAGLLSLL